MTYRFARSVKILSIMLSLLFSIHIAYADFAVESDESLVFPAQQTSYNGSVGQSASSGGVLKVTGPESESGVGEVTDNTVILDGPSGHTISAWGFTYGGDMDTQGNFNLPSGTGETSLSNLRVGATATIPANSASGTYTGMANFKVTVDGVDTTTALPVTIVLLADNDVQTERDMVFPPQLQGISTTVALSPSSTGAAMFSATGGAGSSATASVVPTSLELECVTQPSAKITVQDFTFGGEGVDPQTGEFSFPGGSGQSVKRNITLGATAMFTSDLPTCDYSGSAEFRVTYS